MTIKYSRTTDHIAWTDTGFKTCWWSLDIMLKPLQIKDIKTQLMILQLKHKRRCRFDARCKTIPYNLMSEALCAICWICLTNDVLNAQEIWANAHEMHESLCQFLFAANIGLSPSISSHFTLLQPKIAQNHKKTSIFKVMPCLGPWLLIHQAIDYECGKTQLPTKTLQLILQKSGHNSFQVRVVLSSILA